MSKTPARHTAVLACMDARLDPLPALGLVPGDAHVVRNGGARVTDDMLRSLAISVHGFGTETVWVLQHTDCGVAGVTEEALREKTGADLAFHTMDDQEAALRQDVERLATLPYLAPLRTVVGAIYDVETGEVREVVRRARD